MWFYGEAFGERNKRTAPAFLYAGVSLEGAMSSSMLYAFGFFVLLAGLVCGAYLVHVPETWVAVGAVAMFCLSIVWALAHTRQQDAPRAPDA